MNYDEAVSSKSVLGYKSPPVGLPVLAVPLLSPAVTAPASDGPPVFAEIVVVRLVAQDLTQETDRALIQSGKR